METKESDIVQQHDQHDGILSAQALRAGLGGRINALASSSPNKPSPIPRARATTLPPDVSAISSGIDILSRNSPLPSQQHPPPIPPPLNIDPDSKLPQQIQKPQEYDSEEDEKEIGQSDSDSDDEGPLENADVLSVSSDGGEETTTAEHITITERGTPPKRGRLPSLFYDANGELSAELGEVLFEKTYYDRDELHLLYKQFITIAPDTILSHDQFVQNFPPFTTSKLLVDSLFNAIDRNNDGFVQFYEYATLLSVMTRGSKLEKIELAFQICDLDGDGFVHRSDVLEVITAANEIFSETGDAVNYSTPFEVVDSLFAADPAAKLTKAGSNTNLLQNSLKTGVATTVGLFGLEGPASSMSEAELGAANRNINIFNSSSISFPTSTITLNPVVGTPIANDIGSNPTTPSMTSSGGMKAVERMSLKEFVKVAELDPDLYRCFGMFDYFYYTVIRPIEATLKTDVVKPGMQGHLLYHKNIKMLGGLVNKVSRRFFVITEGFLIQYHHMSKNPRRVICLLGARVKAIDYESSSGILRRKKKSPGFILDVGGLYTTSSITHAKEWVHSIRANAKGGYKYQAFAPIRANNEAKAFVNGKEYYAALAKAIPQAKHEIYIAGWWVAPEVYLMKKKPHKIKNRLDEMLRERADHGVQIKVLVWDETSLGITIGSSHTKSWLEGLHKNVHVVKHPKIYPLSWSHHQKMVVIDQQYAFVGGIDLCFMRYDDDEFTLVDLEGEKFPGKDYGNLNVFVKRTGDPMVDQIDRKTIPRLPWHDVTVSIQGIGAADVALNFIQRWNHSIDSTSDYKNYPYLFPKPIRVVNKSQPSLQNLLKDFKEMVTGNELEEQSTPTLPRRRRSRAASLPANKSFGRIFVDEDGLGSCETQVVRSICEWSAGQEVEDSCYKAYMDMISKAERFIYIQNLYFISSTGSDTPKNRIALAILRRVRRAIQNNESFRVVILVSVYPAGEIDLPSTRMLIGWTMKTICRGGKSILELLQAEFPDRDIGEYVSFYCLRSWQYHKGIAYTEEVYVHSKVMIVDDRTAIVGSANINDRSMRGSRDSELCVVVRDKDEVDMLMDGKTFKAGAFAHNLRKRLWSLHLGVSPDHVADPIHPDTFHGLYRAVAQKNSEIFALVFGDGIPENQRKLVPIRRSYPCDDDTRKLLQQVQGYLILFPYHFLEEEYLEPSVFNKEWFLKTNIFI